MRLLPPVLAAALFAAAPAAALTKSLRVIAATGQPVAEPGAAMGTVYPASVNASGEASVLVIEVDAVGGWTSLYRWDGGLLTRLMREGEAVPSLPGAVFAQVERAPLDDAGRMVFGAGTVATGELVPRVAIFESAASLVTPLVLHGAPAPGGGEFSYLEPPFLSPAGYAAFFSNIVDTGIWRMTPEGVVSPVARNGEPAPGLPGWVFSMHPQNRCAVNDAGEVHFESRVRTGVPGESASSLWGPDGAGGSRLVALEGAAAPGLPGATIETLDVGEIDASGTVAFSVGLDDGGVFLSPSIWTAPPDGPAELLVRRGDPAPSPAPAGSTFQALGVPLLDGAEGIVFWAEVGDGEYPEIEGLWRAEADGTLAALVLAGDPAPDSPDTVFETFSELRALGGGRIAYVGRIAGPGVSGDGYEAAFFRDADGTSTVLFRNGDLLEVAPGDLRIGRTPRLGTTTHRPAAAAAADDVAYVLMQIGFEDGYAGVVVAVPEPAPPLLALTGALVLAAAQRRRTSARSPRQSA
jgi:hypothetical protein